MEAINAKTYVGSTLRTKSVDSPLGPVRLLADDGALVGVRLPEHGTVHPAEDDDLEDRDASGADEATLAVLDQAVREFEAYFAGRLRSFSIPLATAGTPFQEDVWRGLRSIPFGESRSYAWLAKKIRRPRACRAVGAANGRNPLGIVVPCHRVIGSDGSLTGYGGGLDAKRWLLEHEKRVEELGRRGVADQSLG